MQIDALLKRAKVAGGLIVKPVLILIVSALGCSGCALTRNSVLAEDGTKMTSWAFVTTGSRITGKTLAQELGVDADGTWRMTSGERVDEMMSDSAWLQVVVALAGMAAARMPVVTPGSAGASPSQGDSEVDPLALFRRMYTGTRLVDRFNLKE